MNIIVDKLPETVIVDGVSYRIKTNFRGCIKTIMAFSRFKNAQNSFEEELNNARKIKVLLHNTYYEIPKNVSQAAEQAMWFLRCGHDIPRIDRPRLYDFEQDSSYIYAAFRTKGINLSDIRYMHWWEFMALFNELDECFFSRLMYLRNQRNTGKLTKEEKAECNKIGWDIISIIDEGEKALMDADREYFENMLS